MSDTCRVFAGPVQGWTHSKSLVITYIELIREKLAFVIYSSPHSSLVCSDPGPWLGANSQASSDQEQGGTGEEAQGLPRASSRSW